MDYEIFGKCLSIHLILCELIDEEQLSVDEQFNRQLKRDFEQLHDYFDRLTDSKKVKLEDFVY
jgi:hypothetical protein